MHTVLSINEARELYKTATKAVSFKTECNTKVVVFNCMLNGYEHTIQVNTHKTGRKEAFGQPSYNLIDDFYDVLEQDEIITKLK